MAHSYKYSPDVPPAGPDSVPAKTPLPLSAAQESQVRDIWYARVRGICATEIKAFAECATNRTITATWKCKAERGNMNNCMVLHATQEELDNARQDWFKLRLEKRRLRDEAVRAGKEPTVQA
ncbi:cytochrome c oxidase biogenesis protein Cmc1 like-domain-containing protein [Peziza echinospora]|nr:cytochrome c oxidase biogenesis protein Cmc1 like-domain-containing protein [Peziza echinospora]